LRAPIDLRGPIGGSRRAPATLHGGSANERRRAREGNEQHLSSAHHGLVSSIVTQQGCQRWQIEREQLRFGREQVPIDLEQVQLDPR
jgi:hypothetical protein